MNIQVKDQDEFEKPKKDEPQKMDLWEAVQWLINDSVKIGESLYSLHEKINKIDKKLSEMKK